ncbi:MAG: hypothetical protein LBC46_04490, partial [Treponema sp.]|nr:hypothetical protein [Treponema sp.]
RLALTSLAPCLAPKARGTTALTPMSLALCLAPHVQVPDTNVSGTMSGTEGKENHRLTPKARGTTALTPMSLTPCGLVPDINVSGTMSGTEGKENHGSGTRVSGSMSGTEGKRGTTALVARRRSRNQSRAILNAKEKA